VEAGGAQELHDIPYVSGGVEHQRLDLYLPERKAPVPVVCWIHGGGWQGGDKSSCPAKGMLRFGFAAASIEYRLSGAATYPAQIEDCKAAIRFLRAHAAVYGIDPKRIGVWGESAGGHLVALLGTTGNIRDFDVGGNLDQSSAVQCVVDWFGPSDFLRWGTTDMRTLENPNAVPANSPLTKLIGGPVSTHQEAARRASPLFFVTRDSAPFLILHGDKDSLVPLQQSEELEAALQKAGVESTLKVIPGAGHGGPGFGTPENRNLIKDFFERHLGDKSQAPAPSP
jgi:acetyl esterase/lipase